MTTCTDGSVRFGKPGCENPEICIPPFKPICSFDAPRATEPMTLEAPHPRIVLPLPPSDCACFSFEEKNGTVSIKKKADKTAPKFTVEIKQASPDCCEGKYQVTPSIEIPECIMDDETKNGTCKLGGLGGTLNWTLKRRNCELSLEMSGNIPVPTIPLPCLPTFDLNTTTFKIKYKENASDTQEKENPGAFKVRADYDHGCPLYVPEEIYLGVLPSGFSSGGDVFKGGGGSSGFDSGKAYLTGKPTANVTWHGGGYGDRKTDYIYSNYCRGNKMRGGVDVTPDFGETPITIAQLGATQQLVNETGAVAQVWKGQRDPDDKNPDPTPSGYTVGSGNLDIVMPTGSQWNKRGIALTLSQFIWNQSGLLSKMYEHDEAILVSPAPVITSGTDPHNASGLAIDPKVTTGSHPTESGLHVNAGDGLRIYGTDFGSYDSTDTADAANRNGSLEIMYGPGFRIRDVNASDGSATYLDKPVYLPGALVPNDGRGLRVHGFTKMKKQYPNTSQAESTITAQKNKLEIHAFDNDLTFQTDDRLVLNDKKADRQLWMTDLPFDAHAAYRGGAWGPAAGGISGSDAEYSIPLLVAYYKAGYPLSALYYKVANGRITVNGTYIRNMVEQMIADEKPAENIILTMAQSLETLFSTFGVMYQHVGKSGLVLGTDSIADFSGVEANGRFASK